MSEYQYYEFKAVDRALTHEEQGRLRELSSRAEITPWSFVNSYSFGDFKGRPEDLMETMFDAHTYVANWGTRKLMLRLPAAALPPEQAEVYLRGRDCDVWTESGATILTFLSQEEGAEHEVECALWMSSLLPLRADLIRGDRRCLYLTWLLAVQNGEVDDAELEPEVPPSLHNLNDSLRAFVEFMRIDSDLVEAAATGSGEEAEDHFRFWVCQLDPQEKDSILVRLLQGDADRVHAELRNRWRKESGAATSPRRTAAALLTASETVAEARRQVAAERRAAELVLAQQQAAAMKAAKFKSLAREGDRVWARLESMLEKQTAGQYDLAVELLVDLRELAVEKRNTEFFQQRFSELRNRHRGQALIKRLQKAGLA